MKPKFILSTVGMSLLTNVLSKEEKKQDWDKKLNKSSNLAKKDLPEEIMSKVDELKGRALHMLIDGDEKSRRLLSAELNGLYGIFAEDGPNLNDIQYLITSDTFIGQVAAETVQEFLMSQEIYADIFTPAELNTASVHNFSHGMKNLLKWCEDNIPEKAKSGYEIIFNITAAFKSLQGYLNIFGMFYADRITYIFEGSSTLLSIPKLPIKIDQEALERHALYFSLLEKNANLSLEEVKHIPDALIFLRETGEISLSPWGLLLWKEIKKQVLASELLPFPFLRYEQSFRDDFRESDVNLRIRIQDCLAEACKYLRESKGDPASLHGGGLRYTNYEDKKVNRVPIGHFRINDSERISCIKVKGGLLLRHCGTHSHVNKNP